MGETERLVEDAMRAAGIPDRKIGRDARGRIEGVKTAISATGVVLADIATLPKRNDSCYVCIVGRYNSRSQIPSLLGRQSPKITQEVRSTLRGKAGDDLTVL
ncbi:hypothetical protein [Halosimplex pelagicum]|uniref:Uncharacterized protein n=1 Tax=Halosimplex pelagicum TaxID=869886 RepID=A0A7D5TWV8_9EURY|nr:hypothetical protein [Halosimplex pelagicum]QLH84314.1 hypothetical protein HZS54_22920 [Halosimplex pelagicum]